MNRTDQQIVLRMTYDFFGRSIFLLRTLLVEGTLHHFTTNSVSSASPIWQNFLHFPFMKIYIYFKTINTITE